MKILVKLFGLMIKLLGKSASKEALYDQIVSSLDTNGDKKLTLEDYANGKWKDIHWGKLVFAVIVLAGSLYLGYMTGKEVIDYVISHDVGG